MRSHRIASWRQAFYQFDRRRAVRVDALSRPQGLPGRVLDFTAKPGRFLVLVEADALDGLEIAVECEETEERAPEAVATYGNHGRFDRARSVALEVDHPELLQPLERRDVFVR